MATIDSETPVVSIAYHQRIEDVVATLGTDALHGLTDLKARTRLVLAATALVVYLCLRILPPFLRLESLRAAIFSAFQ